MRLSFRDTYANFAVGCIFFGVSLWPVVLTLSPEFLWLKPYLIAVAVGSGLVGMGMMLAYPISYLRSRLLGLQKWPGFAAYLVVILGDAKVVRKKYLFEFLTPQGASVSFYISASDHFTLSVKDVRGDIYPLEVRVGLDTIPLHAPIYLAGEVGIMKHCTFLRILVGTKEVGSRTLPFEIDLGSREWAKGGATLGADSAGQNHGQFTLGELVLLNTTPSNPDRKNLIQYFERKWGKGSDGKK